MTFLLLNNADLIITKLSIGKSNAIRFSYLQTSHCNLQTMYILCIGFIMNIHYKLWTINTKYDLDWIRIPNSKLKSQVSIQKYYNIMHVRVFNTKDWTHALQHSSKDVIAKITKMHQARKTDRMKISQARQRPMMQKFPDKGTTEMRRIGWASS